MNDDIYNTDPRANSVEGFIAGLVILANHMEGGLKSAFFCGAEHDIIFLYVGSAECPEVSEDGISLLKLGFHFSEDHDSWAYFT